MKKTSLGAALCLALCIILSTPVSAQAADVRFILDGTPLRTPIASQIVNQTTYVSYWPIVKELYPAATAVWANGQAEVRAPGLTLDIRPGCKYIVANGRYLYVPGGVLCEDLDILVPVRVLSRALGASVSWQAGTVSLASGGGPILPAGQAYDSTDLYWLSHIIYAESGNQPLEGKIAVGNVVLNRVNSSAFPNTIYGVLFQRGQFTPAMTGSIYSSPNEESILAAKLCLDGANTGGDALYFVNPKTTPGSWAARNRPYVATIGAHAFFS